MRWLPGWGLLIYVAIDLANPFVPGALSFSPDEGVVWVEALTPSAGARSEPDLPAVVPGRRPGGPPDGGAAEPVARPAVPARPLSTWLAEVRTGDPPVRDLPPPSSDDH